jgi:hypothetical protein
MQKESDGRRVSAQWILARWLSLSPRPAAVSPHQDPHASPSVTKKRRNDTLPPADEPEAKRQRTTETQQEQQDKELATAYFSRQLNDRDRQAMLCTADSVDAWLNDKIMDAFLSFACSMSPDTLSWSTLLWENRAALYEGSSELVELQTSQAGHGPTTRVVSALNTRGGTHWVGLVISLADKTVLVSDSTGRSDVACAEVEGHAGLRGLLGRLCPRSADHLWRFEALQGPKQARGDTTNCGVIVLVTITCKIFNLDVPATINPIFWRYLFACIAGADIPASQRVHEQDGEGDDEAARTAGVCAALLARPASNLIFMGREAGLVYLDQVPAAA